MSRQLTLHKQQGITLLILAVIIVLAFATFSASRLSINDVTAKQLIKTQTVLKEAKAALIAYVVSYPEAKVSATIRGPGYFPCPDLADINDVFDGKSQSSCNGPETLGRYPWKTIGSRDFKDSANESLWYALSETFDNTGSPDPDVINVATVGTISLRRSDGSLKNNATTNTGIVAIIIAPGTALTRVDGYQQNRGGDPNSAIDYLDILNGEDNAVFEHNTENGFIEGRFNLNGDNVVFNDAVIVITKNDIMSLIQKRVRAEMQKDINCFREVYGIYPDPDVDKLPVNLPEWGEMSKPPQCADNISIPWIKKESWQDYYSYTKPTDVNNPCDDNCIQAF